MPTASTPDDHAANLRNALVDSLVNKGSIVTPQVREAFASVPRHLFVPNVDVASAYADQPVFIRWDDGIPISSSTQPTMMAIMAEQLHLEPGSRVLEIGAGTGYNAAVLAHIVGPGGSVVTVDIDQDIVDEAAGNLARAGYHDVEVVCGDGFAGHIPEQPYDRIMVTVGAQDVSPHWVEQLQDGGIMVVPLWFRGYRVSVALQKRDGLLESLSASPCMFIPIRGIADRNEGYYPIGDAKQDLPQTFVGMERDDPDRRRDLERIFTQEVQSREIRRSLQGQFHTHDLSSGLYMFLTIDPRINIVHWETRENLFQGAGYALIDLETMSAAVLADGHPDRAMVYGGDAAYPELTRLLDRWDEMGRPSIHDLRIRALSVSPPSIPEDNWVVAKRSAYTWVMSWDG
ncbi:MAG: methyltransferase domain-containing protein [Chloroflexota bacterium]|nr:methyltransferase domain-containing protein [Chloroflexota bacterium]MDE2959020.1 methyltransferase domain-containing protein [Chloroflexota bacterium]